MEGSREALDARGVAAAAAACVQAERAAGCELLELAALWAVLHPADGVLHEQTPLALAGERSMRFGGDGTPDVAEFAPAELGLEIGLSPAQARALIADAVDLHHRFPLLWARVRRADVPAWQARRVADQTRGLSREQAGLVDRRLCSQVGLLSRTRLDNLIAAELLRVDRERAQREAEAAARFRGVRVGQSDHGVSELWVRADTADVLWNKAQIRRLADILMADPGHLPAGVPDRGAQSRDEWEALAAMVLGGRPLVAARVLAEHEQPDLFLDVDVEDAPVEPSSAPGVSDQVIKAVARRMDPEKSAPTVVLHVHVGAHALPGLALLRPDKCRSANEADIARVEGVGPVLLDTVRQWLGTGCRVRLEPVIDPDRMPPVDAYEVPDRMVAALLARSPASVFPWSSSQTRRMDVDHTIPYVRPSSGAPPGQTALGNLGPMSRREHRFKTFGRVAVRQTAPGTFVWRTRFGRVIITNPSGTHDLGTGPFVDALWGVVSAGQGAAAA